MAGIPPRAASPLLPHHTGGRVRARRIHAGVGAVSRQRRPDSSNGRVIVTTRNVNSQIDDYLIRLRAALEDVWPPRRDQILADIEEHIAAALEELEDPTEPAIAQMLAQVGDPSEIA